MFGTAIVSVRARQVYTNRGLPGVEAVVTTENGSVGRGMCTSGVSVGTHEITFSFDGGSRFGGKGVMNAVRNVNDVIGPALIGMDAKLAQYIRGKAFVDAVVGQVGMAAFNTVWTSPETMPTMAEIGEPDQWIARVL